MQSKTKTLITNMWYYYLSLESDLEKATQYIEPRGQEKVYSIEFHKLIVLACVAAESSFKLLMECSGIKIDKKEELTISQYKGFMLNKYPQIVNAKVNVMRWGKEIKPFECWKSDKKPSRLSWWDAYNSVKHNKDQNFSKATYENAAFAISAVHLLTLYCAAAYKVSVQSERATCITSEYCSSYICGSPSQMLPDFNKC